MSSQAMIKGVSIPTPPDQKERAAAASQRHTAANKASQLPARCLTGSCTAAAASDMCHVAWYRFCYIEVQKRAIKKGVGLRALLPHAATAAHGLQPATRQREPPTQLPAPPQHFSHHHPKLCADSWPPTTACSWCNEVQPLAYTL